MDRPQPQHRADPLPPLARVAAIRWNPCFLRFALDPVHRLINYLEWMDGAGARDTANRMEDRAPDVMAAVPGGAGLLLPLARVRAPARRRSDGRTTRASTARLLSAFWLVLLVRLETGLIGFDLPWGGR